MNVVLAGGGTAGHIEPALALADALRRRDPATNVTLLGTERGLETTLVPARGYELDLIPAVPLPRSLSADLFSVPFRLRGAVKDVRAVFEKRSADVLVGFGGYVAMPAYLAARKRVPIVVHEANAKPGLANVIGARYAKRIATTYAGTQLGKAEQTGIPLRESISAMGPRSALRAEACAAFGLSPDLPVLLVTGGSQGARRINAAVTGSAATLTVVGGVQVLHVTGAKNAEDVRRSLAELGVEGGRAPYVTVPYVDRMDLAYAAADLALCRSGAMTVAELTAVGLPAVFVPLPIGNGEQRLNATHVVKAGGALMVEDAQLTDAWVNANVLPLLKDPARLAAMSEAAASQGRPNAADRLAEIVAEVAAS